MLGGIQGDLHDQFKNTVNEMQKQCNKKQVAANLFARAAWKEKSTLNLSPLFVEQFSLIQMEQPLTLQYIVAL